MNLLDTVVITSRSFSKNEALELIKRSPLYDFELRSQQDLNTRITEHRQELVKKLMRAISW
ncbi:hypothetical protein N9K04_02245 [Gammaproteobacteria bacterium]|nr:hypothetical protein [Gammaproteobacteria bacterium]MDB3878020.1 hypothetical protein [Gammaproteobacteria bacterium]MDC0090035.1 hypothetical protein [Gammaproteobacteria bacterium]